MAFGLARLHIVTTVPPGSSLVGAFPHNLFRVEQAKLTKNDRLRLCHADGQYVPFDGERHRLVGMHGTTLTIGNFVAFCVNNTSDSPEPLEMQVLGTVADAEERVPGEPVPELSHNHVLGVLAVEATFERAHPPREGGLGTRERLDIVTNHHELACDAVEVAFDEACKAGNRDSYDALERAEAHADRLHRLEMRAKTLVVREEESLLEERRALGFSDEVIERMKVELCEALAITREELDTREFEKPGGVEKLYLLWMKNRKPLAARSATDAPPLAGMPGDEIASAVGDPSLLSFAEPESPEELPPGGRAMLSLKEALKGLSTADALSYMLGAASVLARSQACGEKSEEEFLGLCRSIFTSKLGVTVP